LTRHPGRAGVSADMALRLSQAFGTSAEMWVSMQASYDLWAAWQTAPHVWVPA
jgi:addiction module HigA family antidote